MFQLAQRLGFDLADAFAGDAELLADFLERMIGVHADAETHAQHTFFARGERGEDARYRFLQIGLNCRIDGDDGVFVFDEIAEMRILLVTDRRFEADRFLGDFHHLADFFERHRQALGHFFGRRLAALFVEELAAGAHELVDRFDHVHRNADRTRLVGDAACDCLANPPGRIGREFVAAAIFEFIDRFHQADVAFLNKIKELQAAVGVFFRNRNDEAKVGFDHFLLGDACFAFGLLHCVDDAAELAERHAGRLADFGDFDADAVNSVGFVFDKSRPLLVEPLDAGQPRLVEFAIDIAVEERLARDFVTLGKAQHLSAQCGQAAIERIKLVNQIFDLRAVKLDAFDFRRQLFAELVIFLFLASGEIIAEAERIDARLLNFREFLVKRGNRSEFFKRHWLECFFHLREREGVILFLVVRRARRAALGQRFLVMLVFGNGRNFLDFIVVFERHASGLFADFAIFVFAVFAHRFGRRILVEHRVEIDDLAELHRSFVKRV